MNDEKIEQLFKRSLFELPTQGYLEQGEPKLYAFDELEAIYATATDNPLRNYLKTMLTNTNYVGTQPGFMDQFNWQTDAGKRKLITFGHKKSDEHVFYYTEITPRLFRKATVTKQRVTFNNGEIVRHKKNLS